MSDIDTKLKSSFESERTLAVELASQMASRTERAFSVQVSLRFGDRSMVQSIKVERGDPRRKGST